MHTLIRRLFPLSFACLLLLGACSTPSDPNDRFDGPSEGRFGPTVMQITNPDGMTRLENQQSILNAARVEGWEVLEVVDGESTGRVKLYRKTYLREAILTLRYDATAIEGYIESYGLAYDGRRKNRSVPEGWILDLQRRIARFIELEAVGY